MAKVDAVANRKCPVLKQVNHLLSTIYTVLYFGYPQVQKQFHAAAYGATLNACQNLYIYEQLVNVSKLHIYNTIVIEFIYINRVCIHQNNTTDNRTVTPITQMHNAH